jgi:hypothetical protein
VRRLEPAAAAARNRVSGRTTPTPPHPTLPDPTPDKGWGAARPHPFQGAAPPAAPRGLLRDASGPTTALHPPLPPTRAKPHTPRAPRGAHQLPHGTRRAPRMAHTTRPAPPRLAHAAPRRAAPHLAAGPQELENEILELRTALESGRARTRATLAEASKLLDLFDDSEAAAAVAGGAKGAGAGQQANPIEGFLGMLGLGARPTRPAAAAAAPQQQQPTAAAAAAPAAAGSTDDSGRSGGSRADASKAAPGGGPPASAAAAAAPSQAVRTGARQ